VNTSFQRSKDTRWYLGVRCHKCYEPILFALDRSEGTAESTPPSAGKLVLTCTTEQCRHRADYTAAPVSRFQKQPADPMEKNNESKSGKHKRPA
jgi:hypothetical protein